MIDLNMFFPMDFVETIGEKKVLSIHLIGINWNRKFLFSTDSFGMDPTQIESALGVWTKLYWIEINLFMTN